MFPTDGQTDSVTNTTNTREGIDSLGQFDDFLCQKSAILAPKSQMLTYFWSKKEQIFLSKKRRRVAYGMFMTKYAKIRLN